MYVVVYIGGQIEVETYFEFAPTKNTKPMNDITFPFEFQIINLMRIIWKDIGQQNKRIK